MDLFPGVWKNDQIDPAVKLTPLKCPTLTKTLYLDSLFFHHNGVTCLLLENKPKKTVPVGAGWITVGRDWELLRGRFWGKLLVCWEKPPSSKKNNKTTTTTKNTSCSLKEILNYKIDYNHKACQLLKVIFESTSQVWWNFCYQTCKTERRIAQTLSAGSSRI